jgi:drug/metabolite transporter (DMT)-like permease
VNKGYYIGFILGILYAIFITIVHMYIKKLNNEGVDFSTTLIYSSYYGIPISAVLVLIFDLGFNKTNNFRVNLILSTSDLYWQIFYLVLGSLLLIFNSFFAILAFKYEDASKVSIVFCLEILFVYLFEYQLLNIVAPWMVILGGLLITFGSVLIFVYRIFDRGQQPTSCLGKFFCFKF